MDKSLDSHGESGGKKKGVFFMVDGWNDEFDDELTACLLTQNTRKQLLKSLYICFSSFNLLLLPSHMFY